MTPADGLLADIQAHAEARPKAYSYLRFSTPEQMQGDSYRRQSEAATAYAKRHGLDLDTRLTFEDLGVSGYRGANAGADGQLGAFLEAVRTGLVASGSFLLVESFDRISRQSPWDVMPTIATILNAGITLVTLADGQAYDRAAMTVNPMALMMAIMVMMRANEESATKGRRVAAAWKNKRDTIKPGSPKPYSRLAPAWLHWDGTGPGWQLIPERAAVLVRIFADTVAGVGQATIARSLNDAGVKPWGRATSWGRSYIKKLQENEAVVGTLTPHTVEYSIAGRVRTKAGASVPRYYPAAIEIGTWEAVQALRPTRGRHQPATSRGRVVAHVLAGLAVCGLCGGTMTRVVKGKRSVPKLVCVAAKTGRGCKYLPSRVDQVEDAILTHMLGHVLSHAPSLDATAEADLTRLDNALGGLGDHIERAVEAVLANPRSPAIKRKLDTYEAAREDLLKQREGILRQIDERSEAVVSARVAALAGLLEAGCEDRPMINAALRRVFSGVVVVRDDCSGLLQFRWQHVPDAETALVFAFPALQK